VIAGWVCGVALLGSSGLVWRSSSAAFSATTSNTNALVTATVSFGVNNPATALFTATGLLPGSTGTGCTILTYTGTVSAAVKLYLKAADFTDGGLANYLTFQVSEGTATSSDCQNWVITGSPLYNATGMTDPSKTLTGFAAVATAGLGSWTAAPGATRAYRFDWKLQATAPLNKSASATFTWGAQT
jgi:hypothetical protein